MCINKMKDLIILIAYAVTMAVAVLLGGEDG